MKRTLLAVAALAIATIGPPALAAPAPEVKIAIERAAPPPLVDLVPPYAAHADRLYGTDGGKLDLVSPALPAAAAPSSSPLAVAAAGELRDRDPIAYHLRL